ncbi:MAG: restriction endonuclease [Ferruginibacter sp.]
MIQNFKFLQVHKDIQQMFNLPAYKKFIEHQNLFKAPPVVAEALIGLSKMSDYIDFTDTYTTYLRTIDSILKPSKELQALGEVAKLMKQDFNLSDLINLEEEEEDEVILIDETKRIKRIITDIYNDNSIALSIQPREFEEVVAELLNSQGFKVELTKQTRDNGYDIIAIKYLDSHNPIKFLVECKRFSKQKVGVEIIRSFSHVIASEKANRGIIVTTSYFTLDAKKMQKETPYLLDYRDKDKLMEWIDQYYKSRIVI